MIFPKNCLDGLRFPATRLEVLRHALARGADDRTVGALRRLPERKYQSFDDLAALIERAPAKAARRAA